MIIDTKSRRIWIALYAVTVSAAAYLSFVDPDSIAGLIIFSAAAIALILSNRIVQPGVDERKMRRMTIVALSIISIGAISPLAIGYAIDIKPGREWILLAPGALLIGIGAVPLIYNVVVRVIAWRRNQEMRHR